jgi:hypothetical protein
MTTSVEDILLFSKYPSDKLMKKEYEQSPMDSQYIYDDEPEHDIPVISMQSRGPPPMQRKRSSLPSPTGCGCCHQCKCSGRCTGPVMMSCLDMYEHISRCPVCAKMYQVDKTPYYIIIVVLVVLCIILLKQVLEK